jgi:exopolysaccharide biosynthesis predicted pyruvyltransferase EpsI
MRNNLILVAILSTITTIGVTVMYHLDRQTKLAEEAAAQQRKEYMMRKVDIEANRQDAKRSLNMLTNRYRIDPNNLTSEQKEALKNATPEQRKEFEESLENARKRNASFNNKGMGESYKPTVMPTSTSK